MGVDFLNRTVTPGTVMWTAALVALALLLLTGPVTAVALSRRRDAQTRGYKVFVFLLLFVEVALPFLVLITGEGGGTPATGFYVLFLSLFCYYAGKKVGRENGRRAITELMGLESFDSMEDAQDRLFESRLRFPAREAVLDSIGRLSREQKKPTDDDDDDDGVFDVAVEKVK